MTQCCEFCGCECMTEDDDEGYEGRAVGEKMICMGCLKELKKHLKEA